MSIKTQDSIRLNSQALDEGKGTYIFQLFVTGRLPNSVRAIKNINSICEEHLKGRYELEVIDIHQQPSLALHEEIIATFPFKEISTTGNPDDWRFVKY
jgi:hypothetical protein